MFGKGLATGLVFACLILIIGILVRKMRNQVCAENYDERQLIARSSAFQKGFFTMAACLAVDICIKLFGGVFYEDPVGEFAALYIAMLVFVYKVIKEDAFFGRTQNKKSLYILYSVLVLTQLANSVSAIAEHQIIQDGVLTLRAVGPMTALEFSLILLFQFMHDRKMKREEE